ncbi:General transcription factor II-I repeat domain-containing protein 2 [Frankliniella fusca]|uniref:General transcription factor II-I repeat domain-containing protein 2 n=1 Tax=Frankliniella fusca TaxID=407009 RepID=A0AAE1HXB9_9NEOP|nr:General transcription factor II-I repeat domain-containing protein 2 [Frankliniella fusca]
MQAVEDALDSAGLPLANLYNVATDGAAVMTGRHTGLVARLRQRVREAGSATDVVGIHCIIHREALCAKVVRLEHVMSVVVKTVNFIRVKGHGLNHSDFQTFLKDIEAEYSDVPYFTDVRWLSCGTVLQRFFSLRSEIGHFMETKNMPVPELSDESWVRDLAFFVDITQHLNALNMQLQGKGKLAPELYDTVNAFRTKLNLWKSQLESNQYVHFGSLQSVSACDDPINNETDVQILSELDAEFERWFADVEPMMKLFEIFTAPFGVKPADAPAELQMELIDLQCDRLFKERYRMSDDLLTFYQALPKARFPTLHLTAARIISMFGTTYMCEQFLARPSALKKL